MQELFEANRKSAWGILLVNAKNAFNSLNRSAAIWKCHVQWPRSSRVSF